MFWAADRLARGVKPITPPFPVDDVPLATVDQLREQLRRLKILQRRFDQRLSKIERDLMAAEYQLDSTVSHVRRKGCDDIQPLALARIQAGLEKVRVARERVRRRAQGNRQWTLFAGAANPEGEGQRKIKQKPWSHKVAHKWQKDCDDDGAEA